MTSKWNSFSISGQKPRLLHSSSQTRKSTTGVLHTAGSLSSKKTFSQLKLQNNLKALTPLETGTPIAQPSLDASPGKTTLTSAMTIYSRKRGSKSLSFFQTKPFPSPVHGMRLQTSIANWMKKNYKSLAKKSGKHTESYKTTFAFDPLSNEHLLTTQTESVEMDYFNELSAREALRLLRVSISELNPGDVIYRMQVLSALKKLDKNLREVAWAIGVLELTQEEVAGLLNVNQSTVSRRWKEALWQLRNQV